MRSTQSFSNLLEQYVFSVAATFIDQVSHEEQTILINLINRIDKPATSVDNSASSTNSPADFSSKASTVYLFETPITRLEEQYQEILNVPTSVKYAYKYSRIKNIERLIGSYQTVIETTIANIHTIEQLVRSTEKNLLTETRKANLVKRYQLIKNRYVDYLRKLQGLQRRELSKLETY